MTQNSENIILYIVQISNYHIICKNNNLAKFIGLQRNNIYYPCTELPINLNILYQVLPRKEDRRKQGYKDRIISIYKTVC